MFSLFLKINNKIFWQGDQKCKKDKENDEPKWLLSCLITKFGLGASNWEEKDIILLINSEGISHTKEGLLREH